MVKDECNQQHLFVCMREREREREKQNAFIPKQQQKLSNTIY